MPTKATLAYVLVSKYADSLPLYRQAQIYSRQRIDLDRSTPAGGVVELAFNLTPDYESPMVELSCSAQLFIDETPESVLAPGAQTQQNRVLLGAGPR